MQKKLVIFLSVFSLLLALVYYIPRSYQQTITAACCQDCPISLKVSEEFKKRHPKADIRLLQAAASEQYSEWLAEQFVAGSEPDLFLIPRNDLEKYISLGALMDLSLLTEKPDAPCYALTLQDKHGSPLLFGISARAKYPRLTFELLQALLH